MIAATIAHETYEVWVKDELIGTYTPEELDIFMAFYFDPDRENDYTIIYKGKI